MNQPVRTWPALDLRPVSDLVQAALTDFDACAVDERSDDVWRVFFTNDAERDRAASALRVAFPELAIEPADVPDDNWAARSQASLTSIRAGNIVVSPPWDASGAASSGTITIVIQPSMGFGTGHHATTRLCLQALQRLDLRQRRVLDIGTGSGVLAIAASLLGASEAIGIDDDADAIMSARENAELNPRAEVVLDVADLRSADLPLSDVVVANLTGGLLAATAPRLQQLVKSGGGLVISGLMASEESDVLAAFPDMRVEHRAEEDEWLGLTLRES